MIGPSFLKRALIVGALGSLFAFAGNAQASGFYFWGGYGGGYSRGHCYTPPRTYYRGFSYGHHSYRPHYRSYWHHGHDYGRSYRHHGFSRHRGFDHWRRSHSRGWCR